MQASNDENTVQARRSRTVLAPDNDLSFSAGFLETKNRKQGGQLANLENDVWGNTDNMANEFDGVGVSGAPVIGPVHKQDEEREQEIWGSQQYWSPNDPPLSQAPKKDYPPAYAPGTAENPVRLEDSRTLLNDIQNAASEQAQKRAIRTFLSLLIGSSLVGINRISPIMMLPGTKDLLKDRDIKA